MISSRKNNRNNLDKLNFERKVDQFIEVGRQFVDGVSGTRPGKRRSTSIKELSKRKASNLTKWVNKKFDSIFDEEDDYDVDYKDDWSYQLEEEQKDTIKPFHENEQSSRDLNTFQKKSLTAISLRVSETKPKQLKATNDDWPESEVFQVNRWKRNSFNSESSNSQIHKNETINNKGRNLPKSSRRRI